MFRYLVDISSTLTNVSARDERIGASGITAFGRMAWDGAKRRYLQIEGGRGLRDPLRIPILTEEPALQKIRILLIEMPPMSRDVFKRIMEMVGCQPDMEIVGNFVDPADLVELLLAAGQTQMYVVILGLHNREFPGICSHLLSEYPHIRILG